MFGCLRKCRKPHTASVEIQFDFSDETFEFHRINNEIQATDFIVSGTGFRLLSARLITPTVFLSMSDAQIDGDGIYFTQQDLISAVESISKCVSSQSAITQKT